MKEAIEGLNNPFANSGEWQKKAQKLFGKKKRRDDDAMQVDAAQMGETKKQPLNEEQVQLKREGRCFKCHK